MGLFNLPEFLQQLIEELEWSMPLLNAEKFYPLVVNQDTTLLLKDTGQAIVFRSLLGPCPIQRREEFLIHAMNANVLGQGTGWARIGLESNEKFLTLSSSFPYEVNYQTFKEFLEEFANYTIYWQKEVAKWQRI